MQTNLPEEAALSRQDDWDDEDWDFYWGPLHTERPKDIPPNGEPKKGERCCSLR